MQTDPACRHESRLQYEEEHPERENGPMQMRYPGEARRSEEPFDVVCAREPNKYCQGEEGCQPCIKNVFPVTAID